MFGHNILGIFCEIFSVPWSIVMNLNNVMVAFLCNFVMIISETHISVPNFSYNQ